MEVMYTDKVPGKHNNMRLVEICWFGLPLLLSLYGLIRLFIEYYLGESTMSLALSVFVFLILFSISFVTSGLTHCAIRHYRHGIILSNTEINILGDVIEVNRISDVELVDIELNKNRLLVLFHDANSKGYSFISKRETIEIEDLANKLREVLNLPAQTEIYDYEYIHQYLQSKSS